MKGLRSMCFLRLTPKSETLFLFKPFPLNHRKHVYNCCTRRSVPQLCRMHTWSFLSFLKCWNWELFSEQLHSFAKTNWTVICSVVSYLRIEIFIWERKCILCQLVALKHSLNFFLNFLLGSFGKWFCCFVDCKLPWEHFIYLLRLGCINPGNIFLLNAKKRKKKRCPLFVLQFAKYFVLSPNPE